MTYDLRPATSPMLSVIIPTWNEEENLERLLSKLSRQTIEEFEIIIADADSTDQTRAVAHKYGARVVDGGLPGAGRNRGAEVAKGDVLLFLDADVDIAADEYLEEVLNEFNARSLDVASSSLKPISTRRVDHAMYGVYNAWGWLMGSWHPTATGACMMAKKAFFDALQGFDETITLAEDMEFLRRGGKQGKFGILRSYPIYTSVRRLDQEGRVNLVLKLIRSEWHILTKGPIKGTIPYDLHRR